MIHRLGRSLGQLFEMAPRMCLTVGCTGLLMAQTVSEGSAPPAEEVGTPGNGGWAGERALTIYVIAISILVLAVIVTARTYWALLHVTIRLPDICAALERRTGTENLGQWSEPPRGASHDR